MLIYFAHYFLLFYTILKALYKLINVNNFCRTSSKNVERECISTKFRHMPTIRLFFRSTDIYIGRFLRTVQTVCSSKSERALKELLLTFSFLKFICLIQIFSSVDKLWSQEKHQFTFFYFVFKTSTSCFSSNFLEVLELKKKIKHS